MGGIKNKLSNKLSNKTIPLSDSRLTSPFSQRGTIEDKQSLPLGKGRQMSVAHRWGRYTKYLSITCLSLAILSTLVLNIVNSYSSSNIESNAIDSNSELSTLANDSSICNPTNTNAAACISLSITSSSSSTGGNDANLSLTIPQGGGIATGRHTVEVSSNNVAGYYVMLTGNAGSPAMTPSATTSQAFIQSTTGTLANPTYLDKGQWGSWGIALPNSSLYTGFNTNEMDYSSTDQDVLHKTTWAAVPGKESDDNDKTIIKTTASSKKTDSYPVYYGVRVDGPVSVPADTYAAQVVYTATTNEVPMPTITSTSSNAYELGSGADSTVTITGTNLSSTYSVYLTNTNGDKIGDCTNLNVTSNTQITCTVPTDQTNPDLEAGDYTIHVVTQGGEGSIGFSYTKKTLPDGILESTDDYGEDGHVAVDYDENMIPVVYTGSNTSAKWTALPKSEIASSPKSWYDYPNKVWANAVTVKDPAKYKDITARTIVDDGDILGYWVYIPRYAYKVMRRDGVDLMVDASNFDIIFETAEDTVKVPAPTCSTDSLRRSYQDCSNISQQYGPETGTAWGTHLAFTWSYTAANNGIDKTIETNGFWIGKYELTGPLASPTVRPHQAPNINNDLDQLNTVITSIGTYDKYNASDYTPYWTVKQNSHHFSNSATHTIKNSEWGAAAYLSASKFGAGVNKVQTNTSEESLFGTDPDGTDTGNTYGWFGLTGCGPNSDGEEATMYHPGRVDATNLSVEYCMDAAHSYFGTIGQLASTTNNVTGVYDMAGGAWEYVMGSRTAIDGRSGYSSSIDSIFYRPYVDLYQTSDGFGEIKPWSDTSMGNTYGYLESYTNFDNCTWETCGGQALHEIQASTKGVGWGNDLIRFPYYRTYNRTWFSFMVRGLGVYGADEEGSAGVFHVQDSTGSAGTSVTTRAVVTPAMSAI